MSTEVRPTRKFFRRNSAAIEPPPNLLSYIDQALFLSLRTLDQESIIQATWIYEHQVDYEGLSRFHGNFGYGLAGRLIERSPLPFGRHRWVSALGAPMDIEVADPRPRAELSDWVDERAQLPMDPEWGPGWRIGVLPMTDGSTAISMTGSHALGDGIAAAMRAFEAVAGTRSDLGYPLPNSRTKKQAVTEDLRQAARDLPDAAKALWAAVKMMVAKRRESERHKPADVTSAVPSDLKQSIMLPAIFVTLDVSEWDAVADRLGGNGHSLLAGFAAKVAQHVGRVNPRDGSVTLLIPISERESFDDGRANAVVVANTKIDPTNIANDLSSARAAMRDSVQKARDEPDETLEFLPLIPWMPKRAMRGVVSTAFGFNSDMPVFCSNVGDLPPEILRIDGTPAESLFFRGIDRHVTREALEKRSGLLTIMAGRVGGRVLMSVVAYQPGLENSKYQLRELVTETLSEFGLNGRIE
jgi:hypothetical protein